MDLRIVERAQQGDQEAFAEIAHAIAARLYAVAYRILRDHDRADDAAQHAIVAIWRDLPGLRDPDRFEAWAYRILVNSCYAEARRAKRAHEIPGFGADPTAPDDVMTVADRDQLERGFSRLSADQRAVLVLQHYLDLGLPEIAELLGVPLGTVKSRSHAARQAMRAALEADARQAKGAQPA
ncbi:MAG TPA: sigma-70 family RNA polymerase sigma factor [Candidatus Limnocylindria bacterium]|nr:sigma-70 family RNA polymerase sigma factor [Candidatus Limnocylindria bacterium]